MLGGLHRPGFESWLCHLLCDPAQITSTFWALYPSLIKGGPILWGCQKEESEIRTGIWRGLNKWQLQQSLWWLCYRLWSWAAEVWAASLLFPKAGGRGSGCSSTSEAASPQLFLSLCFRVPADPPSSPSAIGEQRWVDLPQSPTSPSPTSRSFPPRSIQTLGKAIRFYRREWSVFTWVALGQRGRSNREEGSFK